MSWVPYSPEHITEMLWQPINAGIRGDYLNGWAQFVANHPAGTVMVNGAPMVCGGVIPIWANRGCVWTVFNEEAKSCFVPVFRGIKKFLQDQQRQFNRLELSVPVDFAAGHRRAKMLGFEIESTLARKFLPDGTDCVLYSLIREGA
jgi:hypothetical protein